ncbi:MAG: hypothetical protein ACRD5B_05205 [Nitrososphaeraceae archaeon]
MVLSLALTSIMDYYYLSSNNGVNALTKEAALMKDQVEEDGVHFYYYSSIFSNLSRGLPIDEGITSTESPNEQEGDKGGNSNPTNDQGPQQQQ